LLKDIEQSLLKLYSDKCHQQEELEHKYLNEVCSFLKLWIYRVAQKSRYRKKIEYLSYGLSKGADFLTKKFSFFTEHTGYRNFANGENPGIYWRNSEERVGERPSYFRQL
jgi:hypothetical protein